MDVVTKSGEVVKITEKQVYTFPNGLLGFENFKKFALIESEYEPFFWLQSLDEKNLAFLLIDPFLISSSYEADIDDESLRAINVQAPEDIIIMTIVTIPSDGSAITANFLGPVVFNRKNNQCLQVVLNDNKWTTKYDIVDALKKRGE